MLSEYNVYIVEDEPIITKQLLLILESYNAKSVKSADSAQSVLESLKTVKPNLFFLDINLTGPMDGIELAQILSSRGYNNFIYVTSYHDDETLTRAQLTFPLSYIVKPFTEATIRSNVTIALAKIQFNKDKVSKESAANPFFIKDGSSLHQINLADILMVEAFDNYAYVYSKDGKVLVPRTLKAVSAKLNSNQFIRVHKSYLVNINHITTIQEGYLFIASFKIRLGKVYKQALLERIRVI